MMISINSKRTPPPPRQGTFNHRLIQGGLSLAVFAISLMLAACPSPGGGGTTTPNGGGTTTPDGEKPRPPAPEPEKPTPEPPSPPKPKAWHVTTFAGGGSSSSSPDGTGTAASFALPYSIAQSGDTLYVTDGTYHSIRTINTTTAQVGTIVTSGGLSGAAGLDGGYVNGPGTSARLKLPRDIVAAGGNTLYVADFGNHRIRKVIAGADAAATRVSLLAGSGTQGDADGAGAAAEFDSPIGLALSGTKLYVADMNKHRIREIDLASPEYTVRTIAGNGTPGDADGPGSTARFNRPSGLALDASGTKLYVADSDNHCIRVIDLASNDVDTIAGSCGTPPDHADGAGTTAAKFNIPVGLALSGNTLYVADSENHRIRTVDLADPDKTVNTIAGDGTAGWTNGIGTAARFESPTGIAVRGSTLYVTSGTLIRKLEYREVGP